MYVPELMMVSDNFLSVTIITNPSSCALLHNVSDNGSELAFNTTTNKAILNGARYGGTYYISVCGINIIGKGKATTTIFTNGA